jgi:hypothetical protein
MGAGQLLTRYIAALPSNWFYTDTWYQIIEPMRHRKVQQLGALGPGGSGAEALTQNVSAAITRVGDLAGRRYIGGIRIPLGTDLPAIDGGKTTAGQETLLRNLADAMKLNVITSGFVATFRPQVGVTRGGVPSVDLEDAFPQQTVRVMRRRTVGLGI